MNDNTDNSSGKSNDAGYDDEDHHSLQQRRLKTQVDIILSELEGALVYPPEESAEMEYIYRDGRILVRDVDLPRVHEVVGGRVVEPLINGVSALAPGDDFNTQTALQAIDAALGINIGHPDHAVWIVPASACPATEPNPVPHPNPDPAVRRDRCCDGTGAFVSVVDTGYGWRVSPATQRRTTPTTLDRTSATAHSWPASCGAWHRAPTSAWKVS